MNRPAARYVAAWAASVGVSANGVTWASLTLHLAGLGLVAAGGATWPLAVLAYLLLAAAYVLDSADGQVARLTGTSSAAGEWLDHTLDVVKLATFHAAIGYHLLATSTSPSAALPLYSVVLTVLSVQVTLFFADTLYNKMRVPDVTGRGGQGRANRVGRVLFAPLDWGIVVVLVLLLPLQGVFTVAYVVYGVGLLLATLAKSVRYFVVLGRG